MLGPPHDNPQYSRLMGRFRHRLGTSSVRGGIAIWSIVIIMLSVFLMSLLAVNEEFISAYCCCGSGIISIFSVVMGINSTRLVTHDANRTQNDLIVMSMLPNRKIVNGYWQSIFDQLLARQLFPLVTLPFIYGVLNIIAINLLSLHDTIELEGFLAISILTIGQMGFYWFFIMFGIMLALTIRRNFWATSMFVVLSMLLWAIWLLANLIVMGSVVVPMSTESFIVFCLTLSFINSWPYLGLVMVWGIAIFSARHPLWHAWQVYRDERRI